MKTSNTKKRETKKTNSKKRVSKANSKATIASGSMELESKVIDDQQDRKELMELLSKQTAQKIQEKAKHSPELLLMQCRAIAYVLNEVFQSSITESSLSKIYNNICKIFIIKYLEKIKTRDKKSIGIKESKLTDDKLQEIVKKSISAVSDPDDNKGKVFRGFYWDRFLLKFCGANIEEKKTILGFLPQNLKKHHLITPAAPIFNLSSDLSKDIEGHKKKQQANKSSLLNSRFYLDPAGFWISYLDEFLINSMKATTWNKGSTCIEWIKNMKKYNPSSHRLPKNLEEWIDYLDKFFGKDISSDSIDSFISSQDVKKFRLRSEGMELEKEFFKNFRKLVTGNDALLGKLPWFLVMLYHWNKLTEAQFKDYILKDLKSRGVKLSPEMEFDKILHLLSSEHSALYPKKKIFSLSFEELQKFRAIILTLDTPMIHLDVAQTSLLQEYFDYYVRIIQDEDFSKATEWNKAYKEQIPGLTKRDVYSKLIPYFIYNNQTGNWLDDIFKVIVSYYSFSPYSGHNDGDYGETKKCIDSFVIYQYPQLEANNEIPNSENEDSAIPHDRTASYQYAFLSDDTSTDRSNQKINEKLKPFRPLYDKIYFDLYNSLELETTLNGKELKSKQEKFAEEKFNNILRYAQNTSKIVYDHYPSLFDRYAVNIETHPDCFCKPDGINYAIPYTSIIDSTIDRKYHHTDFEFIDSVPETVDPKNFYQNHLRLETQMPDNSFDWAISYFNKAHKAKEKIIDPNNTSEIKIVLHHFDPSKSWDEENKRFIMEFATLDYFTGNARRNLFESFLPTPVRDRKSDKQIDCAARYKNKAQKIQEREELLRYTKNECLILLYLMHWIYHQDQHQGPTPEESFLWNNNIIDPTEQHKINGTLKRHFGSLDPETLSKITLTIRKSFSKIAPSSKKLEDHKIHGYSEKKAPVYDKDTLERKFNEDKEILMTCNSQAARRVFIDKYGEKIFTNTQLQDLITWIREESYRYMEKYYIKEALENDGDHFKINTTGTSFAGCGTWILTADMDESGKPRPFLLIDKRWHVSEDPNKMTYPTSGSADYYDKAHKKEWVKGKEEKDVSKFESIRKNHLSRNPFFTAAVEHYEELGLNLEGKYYKSSGFENPESEMSKFVQKSIDKLTLLSFGLDRGRNVQQFSFYYKSNKTVLDYLKAKSSAETSKEGKLFFIPFKKDIILTFLNNLQIENQAIYSLIKLMELEEDLLWKDEH